MNFEWIWKTVSKKIRSLNLKNKNNQGENADSEQNSTSEKANFCCNTFFSIYFQIK